MGQQEFKSATLSGKKKKFYYLSVHGKVVRGSEKEGGEKKKFETNLPPPGGLWGRFVESEKAKEN